jgi:hypothetical protein
MPPSFHHCPEMPMNKGFSGWKEPSFYPSFLLSPPSYCTSVRISFLSPKNGFPFHSFHPSFHPEMPMDRAFQRIGERMEGDFSILWGGGNICFMKVKFIDMKG